MKDLNYSGGLQEQRLGQQPPQRHKKQVRRRLHTSRPRLVNMAEARKEIVTALKYHRASMKQPPKSPNYPNTPPSPNHLPWSNQPLHDFTTPCHNNINPSSISLSPSSSIHQQHPPMHQAMDDKEMAEIRSIGEQHEMEWNDTMNLVTSAWWFKFFKEEEEACMTHPDGYNPFDGVMQMQFQSSFNPYESLGLQQQQQQDN